MSPKLSISHRKALEKLWSKKKPGNLMGGMLHFIKFPAARKQVSREWDINHLLGEFRVSELISSPATAVVVSASSEFASIIRNILIRLPKQPFSAPWCTRCAFQECLSPERTCFCHGCN
ncbi:hypothetical protein CDAR_508571 [Caerostris darwini]|uniref:Uncharacterized protein n=1 Tax=Caerostris darwini TaxID=1538125 RepID=A0AAV4N017_9ARAC|nr:hypothetical protein CDAR_508571 [Caerostris darwini]